MIPIQSDGHVDTQFNPLDNFKEGFCWRVSSPGCSISLCRNTLLKKVKALPFCLPAYDTHLIRWTCDTQFNPLDNFKEGFCWRVSSPGCSISLCRNTLLKKVKALP